MLVSLRWMVPTVPKLARGRRYVRLQEEKRMFPDHVFAEIAAADVPCQNAEESKYWYCVGEGVFVNAPSQHRVMKTGGVDAR